MLKFLKTVKKFSYKPQPFPALLSHLRDKWASYSGNVNNNNNDHFININEISAIVSASLNRITGYDKVSLLKDKVVLKDEELALLKESVAKAKLAYEDMIDCRRKTQASINALLQVNSCLGSNCMNGNYCLNRIIQFDQFVNCFY